VHDVPEHFRDQMVDKANEKAFNDAVDKPVEVVPELFVNDKGFVDQLLIVSIVLNFLAPM